MKINVKTRKTISVREIKAISFREIRTFGWKDVKGLNLMGENIKVKRI